MAHSYSEFKKLTDDELISLYDKKSKSTVPGLDFYQNELNIRENQRINKKMELLTTIVTILTIINVIFVSIDLLLIK